MMQLSDMMKQPAAPDRRGLQQAFAPEQQEQSPEQMRLIKQKAIQLAMKKMNDRSCQMQEMMRGHK